VHSINPWPALDFELQTTVGPLMDRAQPCSYHNDYITHVSNHRK